LSKNKEIKFDYAGNLTPEKINAETVTAAQNYLETIRKYYVARSNDAANRKEALLTKLQSADSKEFLKLRDDYCNESLEEFVTNKNETTKTIDFNGEIVQKLDPIYMDPHNKFIKAHFYAPVKQVFGKPVDTYTVNVVVLWLMTLCLYLVLYFRLLKKMLDSGEVVMGKKFKGSD